MREESSRTHDVFLSYSSKDKTWADAACAVLERHRVRCWIAPRDITPGDEWGAAIIKGLNGSRIMVLIFSGHANASGQVRREVERAISQGMTVLPVRVEDVRPEGAMEYALGNRHWLDAFTPPIERHLELIARSVKTLLDHDPESPAAPEQAKPNAVAPAKLPPVSPTGRPLWMWTSVVVGVLMLGLIAAWLGGVFKVKTPDGVIVLENVPKDSEILVDGNTITLAWPGAGKPLEIRAVPGQRRIEVKKDGCKTFGEVVTVKTDESEEVTARLEPLVVDRQRKKEENTPQARGSEDPKPTTEIVSSRADLPKPPGRRCRTSRQS